MTARSLISTVCAILVGVTCLFSGLQHAIAQSQTAAKLTALQQTVKAGETIVVDVAVENVTDLYGIQFELKYDQSKFKLLQEKNQFTSSYTHFESDCDSCSAGRTPVYSMIRANMADDVFKSKVALASFTFVALETGKGSVELQQLKAVSTNPFTNAQGHDDLQVIAIQQAAPVWIAIEKNSGNPNPGTSTGSNGEADPSSNEAILAAIKKLQVLMADSIIVRNGVNYPTMDTNIAIENIKKLEKLLVVARERKLSLVNAEVVQVVHSNSNRSALVIPYAVLHALNESKLDLAVQSGQVNLKFAIQSVLSKEKHDLRVSLKKSAGRAFEQDGMSYLPASSVDVELFWLTDKTEQQLSSLSPSALLTVEYSDKQLDAEKLGAYFYNKTLQQWSYMDHKIQTTQGVFQFSFAKSGQYGLFEASKHYKDLTAVYAKAQRAIEVLTAHHKVTGTSHDKYSPNKAMTRAEFVAVLARVMNWELTSYSDAFHDVSERDWFADYVGTAARLGVVKGAFGKFNPHAEVSREEMVVMLMRAHKLQHAVTVQPKGAFTDDSSISGWAKQGVYEAKELGFVNGVGGNRFEPNGVTKRADMAVLFYNYLKSLAVH